MRQADASLWIPFPAYSWTSDHDLVAFARLGRRLGFASISLRGSRYPQARPTSAELVRAVLAADMSQLSPDGSWLLLLNHALHDRYEARSLSSGKIVRWHSEASAVYSMAWLSDGHRFVAIEDRHHRVTAIARSVDLPSDEVSRDLPGPPFAVYLTGVNTPDNVVSASVPAGLGTQEYSTTDVRVCRFSMLHPDRPTEVFNISPPRQVASWYPVASRGGEKLACIVTYDELQWTFRIQNLLPFWNKAPRHYKAVWVTELGSARRREIGSLAYERNSEAMRSVQWCPDDRRLSYVAKDAFWAVAVE